MTHRLAPAAASAVGLFLVVAAAVATVSHAPQPAIVFGALGLAHLVAAAGIARGSRLGSVLGAVMGTVTVALVAVGMVFIVGIESAVGIDLNTLWFAPLNGYATIGVAGLLVAVSLVLVAGGIRAQLRRPAGLA